MSAMHCLASIKDDEAPENTIGACSKSHCSVSRHRSTRLDSTPSVSKTDCLSQHYAHTITSYSLQTLDRKQHCFCLQNSPQISLVEESVLIHILYTLELDGTSTLYFALVPCDQLEQTAITKGLLAAARHSHVLRKLDSLRGNAGPLQFISLPEAVVLNMFVVRPQWLCVHSSLPSRVRCDLVFEDFGASFGAIDFTTIDVSWTVCAGLYVMDRC